MWIVRDKDGLLHLFEKKPIKTIYGWKIPGELFFYVYDDEANEFSEVKWEDEEPTKLLTLPQKDLLLDKLEQILSNYLRGGDIDEIIDKVEQLIDK